jgi:hypothetical protein
MSRRTRSAERQREYVRKNAERILADTKYDALRTPGRLVALVVAYVVVTVAMAVLWLRVGNIAGIAGVFAWGGVYLLLRVAVRAQADLPDHVLDERMRAERDRVYLHAFRGTSTLIFLGTNVLFASVAFRAEPATVSLGYAEVSAIFWSIFSLIMGAPSVAMALDQRHRFS